MYIFPESSVVTAPTRKLPIKSETSIAPSFTAHSKAPEGLTLARKYWPEPGGQSMLYNFVELICVLSSKKPYTKRLPDGSDAILMRKALPHNVPSAHCG